MFVVFCGRISCELLPPSHNVTEEVFDFINEMEPGSLQSPLTNNIVRTSIPLLYLDQEITSSCLSMSALIIGP